MSIDQRSSAPGHAPSEDTLHTPPNALGRLFEQRFNEPGSLCHSYSELERLSGVSRESISRYVSGRRERHRSPTITTLIELAHGVDLPLEQLCRAALMSRPALRDVHQVSKRRAQEIAPLLEQLTEAQFGAWLACLRSMLNHG